MKRERKKYIIDKEMSEKGNMKEKDRKKGTRLLSLGARCCYYAMNR